MVVLLSLGYDIYQTHVCVTGFLKCTMKSSNALRSESKQVKKIRRIGTDSINPKFIM